MNVMDKIKETLLEHIVGTVVAAVGLLFLVIWKTADPVIWERVSDATPKSALWAWLGLISIAVILEAGYIVHLRRKVNPKLIYRFKVYWDKQQNMYCPKDKSPLYLHGHIPGPHPIMSMEVFQCLQCDRRYMLTDESGFQIELKDAKQRLAA